MSELADTIIGDGPYIEGERLTALLRSVDPAQINALRSELIRLRAARLGIDADVACCEGRPAVHTGEHWPLGATHPAS